jgi:hypothetical protein
LPVPAHHYDTAEVVYRTVNTEGYVSYRGNLYSVPWQCLGEFLPVRITENELIVYGADIEEIARHELFARSGESQKRTNDKHILGPDLRNKGELLRQRFVELGPEAASFFDELVRVKRCGKDEARRILGLLVTYRRQDLVAALERARRYRAYAVSPIERILAAQAQPRTTVEVLQEEAREHLNGLLRESPVPPRSGADYQNLLENEDGPQGQGNEETNKPDECA